MGSEGQGRSELDEGGHHDCGLQEAAYARECVSFILCVFLVTHFDPLFLCSYIIGQDSIAKAKLFSKGSTSRTGT